MDAGGLILYARLLRFFLKQCGNSAQVNRKMSEMGQFRKKLEISSARSRRVFIFLLSVSVRVSSAFYHKVDKLTGDIDFFDDVFVG